MELGKKLKNARLESGLSQRTLCGERITRNMLSQIENGSAKPSMDTLSYLAGRLGKPISFFLEEDAVVSENQSAILSARKAYDEGRFAQGLAALEEYRAPDVLFDREKALLEVLTLHAAAREALEDGRSIHAQQLLLRAQSIPSAYCAQELARERTLLMGKLMRENVSLLCRQLPSIDEELLLRAYGALEQKQYARAAALADAVENRDGAWALLRGRIFLSQKDYASAEKHLKMAENDFPERCVPLLECCYREMGDYKQAYYYACRQKQNKE